MFLSDPGSSGIILVIMDCMKYYKITQYVWLKMRDFEVKNAKIFRPHPIMRRGTPPPQTPPLNVGKVPTFCHSPPPHQRILDPSLGNKHSFKKLNTSKSFLFIKIVRRFYQWPNQTGVPNDRTTMLSRMWPTRMRLTRHMKVCELLL